MNTRNWMTVLGCMAFTAMPAMADGHKDEEGHAPDPIVHEGELDRDDERGDRGYADTYTFEAQVGQMLTIDLTSGDLDTYVILESPEGNEWANDDHEGNVGHSHLSMMVMEEGEYTVTATSFGQGETGEYELEINLSAAPENPPEIDREQHRGNLARGDQTLQTGEYYDTYPVTLNEGDMVTITLNSEDFDTYLILIADAANNPLHVENDDHNGSLQQSQISQAITRSGDYSIYVTSFAERETGDYTLSVMTMTASDGDEEGAEEEAEEAAEEVVEEAEEAALEAVEDAEEAE